MDKLKEKLHIGSKNKSGSDDTYDSSNVGTIEGM
jgi:hypothetical protein